MQLALLPGEHVLSLRYNGFFQQNSEYHDVVRSKPLALRFVEQVRDLDGDVAGMALAQVLIAPE